jgi:hypothetical protein
VHALLKEHRYTILLVVIPCIVHAWCLDQSTVVHLDSASSEVDPTFVTSLDGWRVSPRGLMSTSQQASLRIDFWKYRYDDLWIELLTTERGNGNVLVDLSLPREAKTTEYQAEATSQKSAWRLRAVQEDRQIDLTALIGPDGRINLSRYWTNSGACVVSVRNLDGQMGPLIKSISLRRSSWHLAWFVLPFLYVSLYFVVRYIAANVVPQEIDRAIVAAGVILVLLPVFVASELLAWADTLLLVAIGMSSIPWIQKRSCQLPIVPILACLLALGAFLRFDGLFVARFAALDPDAAGFLEISRSMKWLFDTQHREPLFIWLTKAVASYGDPETQLRLLTVFLSITLIGVSYWCGREIIGPIAGLITAVMVAASVGWAWQASRGLRLEAFTICLLLLTGLIWTRRDMSPRKHAVWMGVAAAATCLLRVTSVWFCVLGMAYGIYRRGWNTRAFVLSVGIAVVSLLPSYAYWTATYGDPFYATNLHIRFYRNLEFQGQPGMPTAEDLALDSTAGPEVTPIEFFFQQHTVFDLSLRTVERVKSTFFGQYFSEYICSGSLVVGWCIVISYGVVVFTRIRLLLIWMAMLLGPIAWLYGPMSGPEWRLVFHLSVFCFLCLGVAVETLIHPIENATVNGRR